MFPPQCELFGFGYKQKQLSENLFYFGNKQVTTLKALQNSLTLPRIFTAFLPTATLHYPLQAYMLLSVSATSTPQVSVQKCSQWFNDLAKFLKQAKQDSQQFTKHWCSPKRKLAIKGFLRIFCNVSRFSIQVVTLTIWQTYVIHWKLFPHSHKSFYKVNSFWHQLTCFSTVNLFLHLLEMFTWNHTVHKMQ